MMKNKIEKELLHLVNTPTANIVFLCGAGISMDEPASLPTVYRFMQNLSSECKMDIRDQKELLDNFSEVNYRFESLIDEIRKKFDSNLLVTKLFSSSTYNQIHYFLAQMLKFGASIITTNFDNCIENAIMMNRIPYDFENRVIYTGADYSSAINDFSQLVKIHGSHSMGNDSDSELVITLTSLAKTSKAFSMLPKWKEYLLELLCGKTIVVMGYSCSDDFDIVPLLKSANPESVIWLNYKYEYNFPVLEKFITNEKIANLSTRLPMFFFEGQIQPFLSYWAELKGVSLRNGPIKKIFTVKQYVQEIYPSQEYKDILNNELFLSYGLYEKVVEIAENTLSKLQYIKAQFRLGFFAEVIQNCNKLLEECSRDDIKKETLYYLSSALHYEKKYIEAMNTAKKCCYLAIKTKDKILYLNAQINYSSILYVYASLQPANEQGYLLERAVSLYKVVLEESIGINIEAEANALWGLGDLERYRGNNENALIYLLQALEILKNIGNSYAIVQLEAIIRKLE